MKVRIATTAESARNGSNYNAYHFRCYCCMEDAETLYLYGTQEEAFGPTFWSEAVCSVECHDALYEEVVS